MDIKIYQEKAQRTCASLGSEKLDLAHMALGIVSELEEYMLSVDNVNAREELADICWYIANYCTFREYSFYELLSMIGDFTPEKEEETSQLLIIYSSRLSDYVKKFVAYNKEIGRYNEIKTLVGILWAINEEDCCFDFSEDLGRNIAKLEARYPEKFTEEAATNRDLKVERAILEGNE